MKTADILLIEDDLNQCESTACLLEQAGFSTDTAHSCQQAQACLDQHQYDAVITDLNLPDGEGIQILPHARQVQPEILFFVLTGDPSIPQAVKAMRKGVTDYFAKPFDDSELIDRLSHTIAQSRQKRTLKTTESRLSPHPYPNGLVGNAPSIQQLRRDIESIADSRSTVLILGESGTGKTLTARAIHEQSSRRHGPFVEIDCGCLSDSLLESELFGHVAGSFTGANQNRSGKFLLADGGTIFLDEIGTASNQLQRKLLRVLQERQFEPVGSSKTHKVDVRVILATNQDLLEMVKHGTFRADLYYRINVITLRQPPLRERLPDIQNLANFHLHRICQDLERPHCILSPELLERLRQYELPGNVRELVNVLERAVVLSRGRILHESDLPAEFGPVGDVPHADLISHGLRQVLMAPERDLIEQALRKHQGKRQAAARELGIDRTTLYKKMKRLGLLPSNRDTHVPLPNID
jgi:DNA-binding NtrC family response regulator